METKVIDNIGFICFDNMLSKEDLKLCPRMSITPPPPGPRCDCCGRHISELKPFGKAGDPLVGNFEGLFLIKNYRRMGPYDGESVCAWNAYYEAKKKFEYIGRKNCDPLEWMIEKYGKEKGEHFYWAGQFYEQISKRWECRDCAVLDTDEYFEKIGPH